MFSAFYADFCLCPKSVIITTLSVDLFSAKNVPGPKCACGAETQDAEHFC